MNKKEYLILCDVHAALNVALCCMNPKHNSGFTDPTKSAQDLVLEAYRKVDQITTAAAEKNPELDRPSPKEQKALDAELKEYRKKELDSTH